VYLDTTGTNRVDWKEISKILDDAYRSAAPKSLVRVLDATTSGSSGAAPTRR
jgi:hypothetical protein